MIELIVSATIGWLTNRVADKSAAGADRILMGDKQTRALRKVVRDAIEEVTRDPSVADGEVLRSALLVESPTLEPLVPQSMLDLTVELRTLIQPRLEALASEGYTYDADQLVELLRDAIGKGIEASAAHEGSHLKLLADTLRDRGILDELKTHRPTPQHVFDYTQTVKQFVPAVLADREHELDELREFCLRPSGESYSYWRGTAWAGKTALLATFVLVPLVSEVTFVSFFIRAGDQDDYQAFLRVVTRQLGVFLGEIPPPYPSHADLDSMLGEAAERCRREDRRLVLVVDGLDEDWYASRTKPRRRPSIASLLPERPPRGMRVIVSGRPNPPVPDDVPEGHPLWDAGIVRELAPSSYAKLSERRAKRHLTDMLEEGPLSRQLLGLIVAAETGLSLQCLAKLTRKQEWEVERRLATVSGRVLHRVAEDSWTSRDRDGGYQLAHRDLRELARNLLGKDLGRHCQRILIWAQEYREQGWPPLTPEYLLRGYFRMLRETGDIGEMVACAVDAKRHDRMLDMSGGEVAALDEITQAQDAVLANLIAAKGTTASRVADRGNTWLLPSLVLLGMHYSKLAWRSEHIPSRLPAAWLRLGHPERGRSLAYTSASEHGMLDALAELAKAFRSAGDVAQGRLIADELVRNITRNPAGDTTTGIAIKVAGVLAAGGFPAQAEEIARSCEHDASRCEALANVVTGWAAQDGSARSRATILAQEVDNLARRLCGGQPSGNDPSQWARILTWAVIGWAKAGEVDRAGVIAQEIEDGLNAAGTTDAAGFPLHYASCAWSAAGGADRGHTLARRLVAAGDPMLGELGADAVAYSAIAYAQSGQVVRAEQVARTITESEPDDQAIARIKVLSVVADAWKESGDIGGVYAVAQQVEELARSVAWPRDRADALTSAAHAWIDAGVNARAEALVREATDIAWTVTNVPKQRLYAQPGAVTSQVAEVRAAMDSLAVARDRPTAEVQLLRAAVPAAAVLGRPVSAENIARHITHRPSRDWALTAAGRMTAWAPFLKAWASLGNPGESEQFTAMVRSILNGGPSAWLVEDQKWGVGGPGGDKYADLALAFLEKFIQIALELWSNETLLPRCAPDRFQLVAGQAEVFANIIRGFKPLFAEPEERRLIDDLCSYAEPSQIDRGYALARSFLTLDDRAWELAGAARAWMKRGGYIYGLQELLAETLNATLRARFLTLAARAWARAGDGHRARAAAREAERAGRDLSASATYPAARTLLFAVAADAWVKVGDDAWARNLAFETEDQARNMPAETPRSAEVHQDWALGDAAVAWLVAGNPDRAVAVTEAIGDQRRQADALIRMARHADNALATTFLARALRLGPEGWGLTVNAITLLEPEALVTAAEDLTRNSGTGMPGT
jgi:hypothetical protein